MERSAAPDYRQNRITIPGIPTHPYRRPTATPPRTRSSQSRARASRVHRATQSDTTSQIESWLRVTLYERDDRFEQIYRLGTIYGVRPEVLGVQVNKTIAHRWNIRQQAIHVIRRTYELVIKVTEHRELILAFECPQDMNRRAIAQKFGKLAQTIQSMATSVSRTTRS